MLVLAWGVGLFLGLSPLEQLQATPAALAIGIAAAVPLLVGLRWTLTTAVNPVRRLVAKVVDELGPLLARHSPLELMLLAALAGAAEEIFFRGVMQAGLARVLSPGGALITASAAFGLAHFITPTYALLAGLAGLYLGGLWLLQGSLLTPILAHAIYDAVALNYLVRIYRDTRPEQGAPRQG